MGSQERYLKPEVIRQVRRLDLRAKFIIEGFLSGLHASPFQGFSTEFSEHRKYTEGDDVSQIDWHVYARTDRYYIRKYEAETNLNGYLVMDLSASMDYTYRQQMTKLDYSICLAAALAYLMIRQSDAVGLLTVNTKVGSYLPPRSRKTQLSNIIALLSKLKPEGMTNIGAALHQVASLVKHKSMIMMFSDLLTEPESFLKGLHHLRHRGHDVILFHVMDEAEVLFPFTGMVEFLDKETPEKLVIDADGVKADYLEAVDEFRAKYRRECRNNGIDYVPIHTGMQFDHALTSYLAERSRSQ